MRDFVSGVQRSSSVKVFGIALLILILLIPVAMTRGVVDDRMAIAATVRHDIMRSWGQPQTVGGPILVLPYTIEHLNYYEDRREEQGQAFLLPRELRIETDLVPEIRHRGIHEVPVYTASNTISGTFDMPETSGLGIDNARFDWDRAYFALAITDARSVRNAPAIEIGGRTSGFEAGGNQVAGFPPQIVAPAATLLDADARQAEFSFTIRLDLSGTDELQYLPLAEMTTVTMHSSWPSPSFTGGYLPANREVRDDGFDATWRVSSLGRALPSRWTNTSYHYQATENAAFGVSIFIPVGIYQLADRATKYAVLIIGLTFVGYFLFEVLSSLHLHPLQYLLVGLANALFYLLLLSFSEHLGFGWSYLVSAAASTGLIAAYSASILQSSRHAALVVPMMVCLYGFLYITLSAETFALLAGSIGLWVSLGLVMYLTRRIDWYKWGSAEPEQ